MKSQVLEVVFCHEVSGKSGQLNSTHLHVALDLPIHPTAKIRLGQVAALVLVDAPDFLHAAQVVQHHLLALALVVQREAASLWSVTVALVNNNIHLHG